MKKTTILFYCALMILVSPSNTFAQFQTILDSFQRDFSHALTESRTEPGYVLAGQTIQSLGEPLLIKTDSLGLPLWAYTYSLPGNRELFFSVTRAPWVGRDEYAAVGYADPDPNLPTNSDIYFLKVDSMGNPMVAKRYATDGTDFAHHIEPVFHPDYGPCFILAGITYQNDPNYRSDINVVLVDANGTMLHSKVFYELDNQSTYWVEPLRDGGFAIVGYTIINDYRDVLVMKLDRYLNQVWSQAIDIIPSPWMESHDIGYSIKEDQDYNLVITGTAQYVNSSDYKPFLMSLSQDGAMQWLKTYSLPDFGSSKTFSLINNISTTGTENVIAGQIDNPKHALMIKTDINGNVIWGMIYPPINNTSTTEAKMAIQNSSGGYAFTGTMYNTWNPNGTSYDVHLVETDSTGSSNAVDCEKKVEVLVDKPDYKKYGLDFMELELKEIDTEPKRVLLKLKTYDCYGNPKGFSLNATTTQNCALD